MQCPLCGGPLHIDHLKFLCERGHELNDEQMRAAAAQRVSTALWMAIEALETEAISLRAMEAAGSGGGAGVSFAEQAETDARVLRELASKHVPASEVE